MAGVAYDTTPSNSSPSIGTVALLEEDPTCKAPLRGKDAREAILGGQTLGPGHPKWVAQPHWGGISNFLSKPKAVTNARFGEPANYYLTIALLSNQLPWLTPAQSQEVGKATTREGWAVAVRHQDNLRKKRPKATAPVAVRKRRQGQQQRIKET